MKLLFLGSFYCPEITSEIQSQMDLRYYQNAPNVFQLSLLNGFHDNKTHIDFLSVPAIPCWPMRYRKTYVNNKTSKINYYSKGESIKFNTIIFIKELSILLRLTSKIYKWAKNHKNEEKKIIIYSTDPIQMRSAWLVKKLFPNIKICVIVTELPEYATHILNIRPFLKHIQAIIIKNSVHRLYKRMDFFVLLTEQMKSKIPIHSKPYCIMEGLYSESDYNYIENNKFKNPTIFYSGTLQPFSSVDFLIQTFLELKNPNYRLIICGSGKLMELVRSAAAKDARIKYIGQVNREEVLVYQRKSTLLINPRQPNNGLTRYTFPSKTMEYMASGTPLLMYELEGIAKEYFNYCYTLDDLSPEALKNTLVNILSKSNEELSIKGRLAREFIINQKSSKVQVKKILDLINQ